MSWRQLEKELVVNLRAAEDRQLLGPLPGGGAIANRSCFSAWSEQNRAVK
jgi:hypothetical protein